MSLRALSAFGLAALTTVLVGCAAAPSDTSSAVGETEDEASAAATSTYYRVVAQDFRKCAFPMCGGVYVSRVNFAQTKCQDGTWQDRCYVSEIDLASLGLPTGQENHVGTMARLGQVLVRGKLAKKTWAKGVSGTVLAASEAWLQLGDGAPSGTFYKVKDSGIQCITFPCPTIAEAKLNSTVTKNVTGLDLAGAGIPDASQAKVWDALSTAVMVAGSNVVVPKQGPAGDGTNLVATAAYLRVSPIASFCTADVECTMTVYTKPVETKSDCYCRTCGDATDVDAASENEQAWTAVCSNVKMTCPAVKCMFREAKCIENACTAVAPTAK